jgi:LCP family protein required for cell wall assembly
MYMGYGGPGHEGEYLTDTILVMSFDPKTGTVTQFNSPRDLYVSIPAGPGGKSYKGKVNGILSTLMKWEKPTQDDLDPKYHFSNPQEQHSAGANLAANTIQNILGFKIDYWITMNFEAFRTLIDKMGGVTVCVDRAFVDNEYPRNDDDQIDAGVMTVKFDAGCQVMNGERAIQFSRSRKSQGLEEGDFARSARQMKVVSAIKDEIMKKNLIGNALGYMDALQGNLRVSMDPGEMFALANFFNSSEGKSIATTLKFDPEIMTGNNFLQESDKGGAIGYALIPQAGEDKYTDIQAWVKSNFNYALIRRENVRVQVLNGSGIQGKGGALTDFLFDRGFRLSETEATASENETYLLDFTNGTATANIEQLKQYLPGMKVYSKTADKKPYDNAPDLMIFMGKDYKGVTTQP